MSVNPRDSASPLLLLAPADWPAAMRGEFAPAPLIFDLHPASGMEVSTDAIRSLLAYLQAHGKAAVLPQVMVRIGGFGGAFAQRDLAALQGGRPDAILLSGCRNAADIQKLDVLLSVHEAEADLPIGSTAILAECGSEAEFFLSPHNLAGKSARLRGLVLNGQALGDLTGSNSGTRPETGPLALARAVCVLKAAEAHLACYEIPGDGVPVGIVNARAASKADGFDDIIVSDPFDLLALSTRIPFIERFGV